MTIGIFAIAFILVGGIIREIIINSRLNKDQMSVFTPLRLFIVGDVCILLSIHYSSLNDNANWAFGLMMGIPMLALIPAVFLELIFTLFGDRISFSKKIWMGFAAITLTILWIFWNVVA